MTIVQPAIAQVEARDEYLPYSAAGPNNPWLIAVAVSIATFMEVLDTTITNVALRNIAGSMGASLDESTYVLTSYLVANAIILPLSGWLATVIGRKRFYLMCVVLFTASSALCATATSLWQLVAYRVLQGLGGGGLSPVEQSIFADSFPTRQRPQAFALYGITILMAPAIGPVLGGWLTDSFSWRWVFLINLPVGVLSFGLVSWLVHDSPALKRDRAAMLKRGLKVDYVGFLLVLIGFGALQVVLDRFDRAGGIGSGFIQFFGSVSLMALSLLVVWEIYHPQPAVNIRLFRLRSVWLSCVLILALGFTMVAATQLLPQMSQSLMGYNALTAGLTLGPASLVTLCLMPVSALLTGRVLQPRVMICAAFTATGVAMWLTSGLDLTADFGALARSRLLQAMCVPFLFIPISSISLVGVPPNRNGDASALLNLMRQLGGSIGVSFCTALLAWRSQFHQARLVEHVTPYNGYGSGPMLQAVMGRVQTQAAMMSYVDIFLTLAGVCFVVAPLALLLPRLPKGASASGH